MKTENYSELPLTDTEAGMSSSWPPPPTSLRALHACTYRLLSDCQSLLNLLSTLPHTHDLPPSERLNQRQFDALVAEHATEKNTTYQK